MITGTLIGKTFRDSLCARASRGGAAGTFTTAQEEDGIAWTRILET